MSTSYVRRCNVAAVAMAMGLLAGCSTGGVEDDPATTPQPNSTSADGSSSPARPTLTAPNLQPPSQDNKYSRAGNRPKIVYDPCTWTPDSAIQEIGFDPQSRRRGNDMIAEYSFLICGFKKGEDASLALESGNVSLDEVRSKYSGRTEELIINGRPAVKTRKGSANDCSIDLQTKVGYLGITVTVTTHGLVKNMQACDDILEIATVLEPSIGKEN